LRATLFAARRRAILFWSRRFNWDDSDGDRFFGGFLKKIFIV
jgi:hypothetical protein